MCTTVQLVCVYVNVYIIHIHIYEYIYTDTYIHIYVNVYIHTSKFSLGSPLVNHCGGVDPKPLG